MINVTQILHASSVFSVKDLRQFDFQLSHLQIESYFKSECEKLNLGSKKFREQFFPVNVALFCSEGSK